MKTNLGLRWRTRLTAGSGLLGALVLPATAAASDGGGGGGGNPVLVAALVALALLSAMGAVTLLSRRTRTDLRVVVPDRPARVLGYASVRAVDEPDADAELENQAALIATECARRGWTLLELVREAAPRGDHGFDRPGLTYALGRVTGGDASVLMVSELSRLSSSDDEVDAFCDRLGGEQKRLVVADREPRHAGRHSPRPRPRARARREESKEAVSSS
jgi:hypothetical protein